MPMIMIKYDIGQKVFIKTPGITAEVIGAVYTGFTVSYRCVYWLGGQPHFYEAFDYELEDLLDD